MILISATSQQRGGAGPWTGSTRRPRLEGAEEGTRQGRIADSWGRGVAVGEEGPVERPPRTSRGRRSHSCSRDIEKQEDQTSKENDIVLNKDESKKRTLVRLSGQKQTPVVWGLPEEGALPWNDITEDKPEEETKYPEHRVQIYPTEPLPLLMRLLCWEQLRTREKKRRKKRKALRRRRRSSTLSEMGVKLGGREFNDSDTNSEEEQETIFGSRKPSLLLLSESERSRHKNKSKAVLKPGALDALRESFALQAERGKLKDPVIHVSFTYPRNMSDCFNCEDSDFLFVYVGLCNIVVLQFVVVVILFFSEKDIDFDHFRGYYYQRERRQP